VASLVDQKDGYLLPSPLAQYRAPATAHH